MPAQRSSKSTVSTDTARRKAGSVAGQLSKKVQAPPCHICGKVVSRKADFNRHMKTHDSDPALRLPCPWVTVGCVYRTLQKSNLETHINRHLGYKKFACNKCDHRSYDKKSLGVHKKHWKHRDEDDAAPASPAPPLSSSIPTLDFPPLGETSPSIPLMPPPSLHCQNRSFPGSEASHHDGHPAQRYGPDPIPSHPGHGHGYRRDDFKFTATADSTSFANGSTALTLPAYSTYSPPDLALPSPSFDYSANQYQSQLYQHDSSWHWTSESFADGSPSGLNLPEYSTFYSPDPNPYHSPPDPIPNPFFDNSANQYQPQFYQHDHSSSSWQMY